MNDRWLYVFLLLLAFVKVDLQVYFVFYGERSQRGDVVLESVVQGDVFRSSSEGQFFGYLSGRRIVGFGLSGWVVFIVFQFFEVSSVEFYICVLFISIRRMYLQLGSRFSVVRFSRIRVGRVQRLDWGRLCVSNRFIFCWVYNGAREIEIYVFGRR